MNKFQKNAQKLLENDRFSHWLGIRIINVESDSCVLEMTVREEMWNGIGTVHGGVTFSFAESALAVASMSRGQVSVALNCTINFTNAVMHEDVLKAQCILLNASRKTAVYDITVENQDKILVASFRGTVYRLEKSL